MDAKQRKKLEAENQKKIAEMLSREENQSCADCGERSPRWASVNLGCFVCIRCCGLHRKMGSHVSKIKSINLDFWLPENIAQCQAWGNGRINQRFLSRGNAPSPNVASDRYRCCLTQATWRYTSKTSMSGCYILWMPRCLPLRSLLIPVSFQIEYLAIRIGLRTNCRLCTQWASMTTR